MAITTNTQTTLPLGAITLYRVVSGLSEAISRVQAWRDARRTAQILSGLSTRQLEDIGLTRADIETLVTTGRF
ncbi:DUF1127 domain-containing protein [Limibaculum sp. FT325]|uniref:DUF1127 domain-containing protein n=1 Tax=Thermohalobaculum sediminis TaxID=2939436 RepID=UPI0020BE2670|nr:DUF1127 domain-containing protein [Limibaculum sediminis]MCL5778512.1 DUF1127 domain-containing protein [Limibaculum sediminis]